MNQFPNFNTQEEYDEWITKYDDYLEKYEVIFSKMKEKFLPGVSNAELSDAWVQTLPYMVETLKEIVDRDRVSEDTPQPE